MCKYLQGTSGDIPLEVAYLVDMPGLDSFELGQAISEGALLGTYFLANILQKNRS